MTRMILCYSCVTRIAMALNLPRKIYLRSGIRLIRFLFGTVLL